MSASDNIRTRWEMDVAQAQQALRSMQTELKQADKATDDLTKSVNTQTRAMYAQIRILEAQNRLMNLAEREIRRNEQAEKNLAQAKERSNRAATQQRRVAAAAERLSQDVTAGRLKLLKVTEDYTASMQRMVTTKTFVNQAGNRVTATYTRVAGKLVEVRRRTGEAEQAYKRKAKAIEHVTFTLGAMGKLIATRVASRAIYAFISATRQALQEATQLSMRIAEIQTISQDIPLATADWERGVRRISDLFGFGILDTAEAAYQTLSNQVAKGAETFLFMEDAAKFAITTNSSLTDSVNLLSSALNSYDKSAAYAATTSAELFKLIELGRVRSSEIANTLGNVTVIASQLSVELREVNAMLAQVTKAGIKSREALTQVRGVMNALLKPTEAMKDFLASLGVESGEAATQAYTFNGVLQKMAEYTNGSSTAVAELIPRIRGMGAVLLALKNGGEDYNKILVQMQNTQDEYAKAVEIASNNLGRELTVQWTQVANFFVAEVAPIINSALLSIMQNFTEARRTMQEGGGWIEHLALATAAGTPLGPFAYLRLRQLEARRANTLALEGEKQYEADLIATKIRAVQRTLEIQTDANNKRVQGQLQVIARLRKGLNREADLLEDHLKSVQTSMSSVLSELASEADANIKKVQASIAAAERTAENITKGTDSFIKGVRGQIFTEDLSRQTANSQVETIRTEIKRVEQMRRQAVLAGQAELAQELLNRHRQLTDQLIGIDKTRQERLKNVTLEQQRLESILADKNQELSVEERKKLRDQILALAREKEQVDSKTTGAFADGYRQVYNQLIEMARKQEEQLLVIQKERVEKLHKEEMRRALELAVFKAQLAKVTGFDLTAALTGAATQEDINRVMQGRQDSLSQLAIDAKKLGAQQLALELINKIKKAEQDEASLEVRRREITQIEAHVQAVNDLTQALIENRSTRQKILAEAGGVLSPEQLLLLQRLANDAAEADRQKLIVQEQLSEMTSDRVLLELKAEKEITAEKQEQARIQKFRKLMGYSLEGSRPTAGGIVHRNTGGEVYGQDSVSAMLTPGEYVMNAASTRKFYSQLVSMNTGNSAVRRYNEGGEVSVGDININMTSSGEASYDVQTLGNQLRREIRRRTISFK